MTPLVTVLLPTHNRPDVLGFAIRSVLTQTVADFELLIVGDGCTDATRDVIATFVDRRIIWFDLPKAPLSGYANRNVALRQARGHYVAYAQDDDLWFPDHLALLLAAVEAAGADWAHSRPLWVGRNGAIVPAPVNLSIPGEYAYFTTTDNSVPSTCVLHTRDALERVGYWPENVPVHADWTCWRAILAARAPPVVGHCRPVTCLHFPTTMTGYVSMPETGLREEATSDWWPAILRCPFTDRTGQETLWRALRDGGEGWVRAIRTASDMVVDHVALTAMRQLEQLTLRVDAAERATAYYRTDSEWARAELAARTADAERSREAAEQANTEAGSARQHAETAEQGARALAAEAAQQGEALARLLGSRSWRLTAPMRAIASAFRR